MHQSQRQAALDNISAEDLAKIEAKKASTKGSMPVDEYWLLLAEFAHYYGWQAYLDVKHDVKENVNYAEMLTLVEAARRIGYMRMFQDSQAAFIGATSAQSKKPGNTFKALTKKLLNMIKADD